jgi:hypothetical protein
VAHFARPVSFLEGRAADKRADRFALALSGGADGFGFAGR